MNKFHIFRVACVLWACAAVSAALAGPPPIQPGSWTLAILPDTQYYAQDYPSIFYAQTQFLATYKTTLNIAYVLHEGDITNSNNSTQWSRASTAMGYLEGAGIRYSIVPGNHDYTPNGGNRSSSLMANYFSVSRLAPQGVYPDEPTSPHNSYSLFSAGGTDWLVLALEFGPRDQLVDWADGILKLYPNRQAMIVTHAYLYCDDTRLDWVKYGTSQGGTSGNPHYYPVASEPGGVNDGQEMWDQLQDNPNLQFVFCGHITGDGAGYLASEAEGGNVVHQMLANYQHLASGGNGYLRLLEFMADGRTVHVRTYSPWLDSSLTAADQDFVLTMTQAPEPGTLLLLACGLLGLLCWLWRRRR